MEENIYVSDNIGNGDGLLVPKEVMIVENKLNTDDIWEVIVVDGKNNKEQWLEPKQVIIVEKKKVKEELFDRKDVIAVHMKESNDELLEPKQAIAGNTKQSRDELIETKQGTVMENKKRNEQLLEPKEVIAVGIKRNKEELLEVIDVEEKISEEEMLTTKDTNVCKNELLKTKNDKVLASLEYLRFKSLQYSHENLILRLQNEYMLNEQECIEYINIAKNKNKIRKTIYEGKLSYAINDGTLVTSTSIQTDCTREVSFGNASTQTEVNDDISGNGVDIAVDYLEHILSQFEILNSTMKPTPAMYDTSDHHDHNYALYNQMRSQISNQQLIINELISTLASSLRSSRIELSDERTRNGYIKGPPDSMRYDTISPSPAMLLSPYDNRTSNISTRFGTMQPSYRSEHPHNNNERSNKTMVVIGNNTIRNNLSGYTAAQRIIDISKPVLVSKRDSIISQSRPNISAEDIDGPNHLDDITQTTLV